MRRRLVLLATLVLALAAAGPATGAEQPPPVPLRAYVIVDDADGAVLGALRPNERRPVASLTKMMTAYLTLAELPLTRRVTVPAAATTIGESTANLAAGQEITVRSLLDALMVPSANDAAETLAFAVSGAEAPFVRRMNTTAKRLGMTNTAYRAPYGLDEQGQFSSATDQVKIARTLMADPRLRAIVRQQRVTVNGQTFEARNNLLDSYAGADGVKTGHTSGAGWCLVASAERNGRRIYVAALGAPDEAQRDAAVATLLDWGFQRYRAHQLVLKGDRYATLPADWGRGSVEVIAERGLRRVLRDGQQVSERIVLPDRIREGVVQGQELGVVELLIDGKVVARVPLVAARALEQPSFIERATWVLGQTLGSLFDPGGWF